MAGLCLWNFKTETSTEKRSRDVLLWHVLRVLVRLLGADLTGLAFKLCLSTVRIQARDSANADPCTQSACCFMTL